MKRILALLLAGALLCTLTGCSTAADGQAKHKSLVVYFSATGNTKAVAQYIADAAKATLFELTPEQPYAEGDLDWNNPDSRVSAELASEEAQNAVVLTNISVGDWESYDTVYLGYPIWTGVAAWPVNSFVKGNDFTGKTVIPFCTSGSGSFGNGVTSITDAASGASVLDGFHVNGSRVDGAQEDVTSWLDGLGL